MKVLKIFIFIVCFYFLSSSQLVKAEVVDHLENVCIKNEKVTELHLVDEKSYIKCKNDLLYLESYNEEDSRECLISEDKFVSFTKYNEVIYVLTDKEIIKISNYVVVKRISLDINYELTSIEVFNDFLYLCGSSGNSPYIMKYDLSLDFVNDKVFESSTDDSFCTVLGNSNLNVLFKVSSSCDNENFIYFDDFNISTLGILTLKENLEVEQVKYLNCIDDECSIDGFIVNDDLKIYITDCDNIYLYSLDESLDVFSYEYVDKIYEKVLPCYYSEESFILIDETEFNTKVYGTCGDEIKHFYDIDYPSCLDIRVIDGDLYYVIESSDRFKIFKFSYYEIIEVNNIYLSVIKNNYIVDDFIKVKAPFSIINLRLSSDSIIPNRINEYGKSRVRYEILSNNRYVGDVYTNVYVSGFINISDGLIYKPGLQLLFYGHLFVNDKEAYNGHILNQNGEYHLVQCDNENNYTEYTIYIDSDYFRDSEEFFNTTYDVETCGDFTIELNINTDKEISKLYVNGKTYNNYDYEDGNISIYINEYCVKDNLVSIDKVEFSDGDVLRINKVYSVNNLLDKPIINISKDVFDDKLGINVDITDDDHTFRYMRLTLIDSFGEKYVKNIYSSIDYGVSFNKYRTLKLELIFYDLGKLYTETLYEINTSDIKSNLIIKFDFERNNLERIYIEHSYKGDIKEDSSIIVGSVNMTPYFIKGNSDIVPSIIISTIVVAIVSIGSYFILKTIKKKKCK